MVMLLYIIIFCVVNPMQFKTTRNCEKGFSLPHLPHTQFPKYPKDNAYFHFLYIKLNMCLCSAELKILRDWTWYTWSSTSTTLTFERILSIYQERFTGMLGMRWKSWQSYLAQRSYISICMQSFSELNLPPKLKSTCCSFFPELYASLGDKKCTCTCDLSPHKSHNIMKLWPLWLY